MVLEMGLKARGSFDQAGEVFRQSEFRPLGRQDLGHAATGREVHVRNAVGVPQPYADGGRRQALLMQADDRLLDLRLLHRDPLRIRLQVRSGRSALSLAVRMDASHRFLGRGCAYREIVFKIEPVTLQMAQWFLDHEGGVVRLERLDVAEVDYLDAGLGQRAFRRLEDLRGRRGDVGRSRLHHQEACAAGSHELEVPEEYRFLVPLGDVLVHDVHGADPTCVRFRLRGVAENRHQIRPLLSKTEKIPEGPRRDFDRGDRAVRADVRDMARGRPASRAQVEDGRAKADRPYATPSLQIRRELAPVRLPPTELSVAPSDETLAVHDGTGDEIPGEEPRPVDIDAFPLRRSHRHRFRHGANGIDGFRTADLWLRFLPCGRLLGSRTRGRQLPGVPPWRTGSPPTSARTELRDESRPPPRGRAPPPP